MPSLRAMIRWKVALLGATMATTACLGSNEDETYSKLYDGPRTSALTENSIRGVWGGTTSQDDVTADWRVAFEADVAHVAVRCKFKDGTRLTPGVTIPVTYGERTVVFANAGENSMKANNGTTCTVTVSEGPFEYRITNNTLPMGVSGRVVLFGKISD